MTLKEKFESVLDIFGEVTSEAFISALSVTNIYLIDRVEEKLSDDWTNEELNIIIDDYLMAPIGEEVAEEFEELHNELFELQLYLSETIDVDEYYNDILKNWAGTGPLLMEILDELTSQAIHSVVLEDMNSKLTRNVEFEKNMLEKEIFKLQDEFDFIDISMLSEYPLGDIDEDDEVINGLMFNNTFTLIRGDEEFPNEDFSESLLIMLSSLRGKMLINCYNAEQEECCIYGIDTGNNTWFPVSTEELEESLDTEMIEDDFNKFEFRTFKKKN